MLVIRLLISVEDTDTLIISLAWAEMYLALAALVQGFDFKFEDAKAEDFEFESDQFAIGTKGKGLLRAHVRIRAD